MCQSRGRPSSRLRTNSEAEIGHAAVMPITMSHLHRSFGDQAMEVVVTILSNSLCLAAACVMAHGCDMYIDLAND